MCGYSVPALEPKMFSFNSPAGACPTCDGIGLKDFFDPQRVVAYPHLSLAGGAIKSWDRKNAYYFALITAMAKHFKFDPETPWEDLSKKAQAGDAVRQRQRRGGIPLPARQWPHHEEEASLRRHHSEPRTALQGNRLAAGARGAREVSRLASPAPTATARASIARARNVFVGTHRLPEIAHLTVGDAKKMFGSLDVAGWRAEVADKIVKEVGNRLKFLVDVGLDYLTLDRSAESLSGGEAQRIRLASQVGSGLTGVMYILDEPSIGLHQRDNQRLLATLKHLRDLGNTVLVVEHDEEAIRAADTVLDIGPGAGVHGGEIVAQGTPADIEAHPDSLTGKYLSGRTKIALPRLRTPRDPKRVIAGDRRDRQQSQERRRGVPARPVHLRDRRVRLGQVDAGQRHAVHARQSQAERHGDGHGALRGHQGARGNRPHHRHRPEPDRPHAALQPGHLHRVVRPAARVVRRGARVAHARLRRRAASAST